MNATATPITGNQLRVSMFFVFGIFASLFLFAGEGHAQARFPKEVVGRWCALHSEYNRFSVKESEYEEGDGLCLLTKSKTTRGTDITSFDLYLRCENGDERQKPFAATHKFTTFEIDNAKYVMRAGSIYDSKALTLYKQCKE